MSANFAMGVMVGSTLFGAGRGERSITHLEKCDNAAQSGNTAKLKQLKCEQYAGTETPYQVVTSFCVGLIAVVIITAIIAIIKPNKRGLY